MKNSYDIIDTINSNKNNIYIYIYYLLDIINV